MRNALRMLTLGAALVFGSIATAQNTINGAGASFPYPLYSKWAHLYNQVTGVRVNYQSIGSSGGIAQIKARTVDFGASDAPLKKADLDEAGLVQFPMVMGGVVPIVNILGVGPGQLTLNGSLLADIYLGKVNKWNDTAIRAMNPGLQLPDQAITVVRRADGSGTTWIFTNYLDKVSVEWGQKVGWGSSVKWPVGVGAKGNEGVASNVRTLPGSIGYVEFAYALENKLAHARLRNREGKVVEPTSESFVAAAASADWKNAPGFYLVLTDQPGKNSWPITGATFILVHRERTAKDAEKSLATLKFFDWCYRQGGKTASELHYIPMPENVRTLVEAEWRDQVTAGGQKVWK